jgi:hypothetical protein
VVNKFDGHIQTHENCRHTLHDGGDRARTWKTFATTHRYQFSCQTWLTTHDTWTYFCSTIEASASPSMSFEVELLLQIRVYNAHEDVCWTCWRCCCWLSNGRPMACRSSLHAHLPTLSHNSFTHTFVTYAPLAPLSIYVPDIFLPWHTQCP